MHSRTYQESNSGNAHLVNHPEQAEWMSFLYDELAPQHKRQLNAHLDSCAACTAQVNAWRSTMGQLDQWTVRTRQAPRVRLVLPVLKWAAAAAVMISLGFLLGRQTSVEARELALLKADVAQLSQTIQVERMASLSNTVMAATSAANTETARLLTAYSGTLDTRRAEDQRTVQVALQVMDTKVARLRAELETVAVNTWDGFQQTHQNLAQLASYSIPVTSQQ